MKIYEYPASGRLSGGRIIALGYFDGVHIGHRRLLTHTAALARQAGISSAVFTFPSEGDLPKSGSARLYTTEEKLRLISECGIDEAIVVDFQAVKDVSPYDFVHRVLTEDMGCVGAVFGRDFRFGKARAGDAALLCRLLSEGGQGAYVEEDVELDGEKVSTTKIKEYLTRGDAETAGRMLGAPYHITASVLRGRGVGHTLGYPTVNLDIGGRAEFLRRGVYKSRVEIGDGVYPALSNVGSCPTFGIHPTHLETFILDYSGDLYGRTLRISLEAFLREERRFPTPEALTEQIARDIEACKENDKEK